MARARFGITLYPLDARINQVAMLSPGFAAADLGGTSSGQTLQPVEDNLKLVNHAVVSDKSGATGEEELTSGIYATSGPGSPGDYKTTPTINIADSSLLTSRASWLVHVGTADADRYPQLPVNLRRRRTLADGWLACTVGSRVTADATYPAAGQPPDIIVEGWTETLNRYQWDTVINGSPALPYQTAKAGTGFSKVDTSGSWLAADVNQGDTAMSVSWLSLRWTVNPINTYLWVGGRKIHVTAIAGTGNPQTFTIDPAPEHIPASDIGGVATPVRLWTPPTVKLSAA